MNKMWPANSKWAFYTLLVTLIIIELASGIVDGVTYQGSLSNNNSSLVTGNWNDTEEIIQNRMDKSIENVEYIDFNPFQEEVDNEKQFTCVQCLSCHDPTCATNTTFESFVDCPHPHKCYHFIDKVTGLHKRGCTKTLLDSAYSHAWLLRLCEKDDDECKTCVGPNCNSAKSFASCLSCTTANNNWKCASDALNSKSKICKPYTDDCFTYIGRGNVSRGCMSDQSTEFKSTCEESPDKCAICRATGEGSCNNKTIFAERCIECDSKNGDQCKENPELYKGKICNKISTPTYSCRSSCYLRLEGDHVQRGCFNDLDPDRKASCLNTDTCKICTDNDCNGKKEFIKCFECNSKDDITCAGNTTLTKSVTCRKYDGACLTGIDENGYTHRRCDNAHLKEGDAMIRLYKTKRCMTTNCNNIIYPPDRLQCYRCNGEDGCNSTNSLAPMPCGRISEPEQCYTYITKDNKTYRGCLADNEEHRAFCEDDDPNKRGSCVKCSEFACNNVGTTVDTTESSVDVAGSSGKIIGNFVITAFIICITFLFKN